MRRLGVIARADDGGLGNQTRDLADHLDPDVCLVVLMRDNARGVEQPSRFAGRRAVFNHGPMLFDETLAEVLAECDVLYTIEGPYHPELFQRCDAAGVELIIHANPELYRQWPCHRLIVPTTWRLDQLPAATRLVPFPVDIDRIRPSARAELPTFVHLTGPAMLDRQGTQIVLDALPWVQRPCEFVIRRDEPEHVEQIGNVTVRWLPPASEHFNVIPDGCWGLVQPRRYGGLSLCIQEAAARGLFTLALDRDPESSYYQDLTIRCVLTDEQPYPMAGGQIGVADTDPRMLAATIDRFIDADTAGEIQWDTPRAWAEAHSWEALKSTYEELFR